MNYKYTISIQKNTNKIISSSEDKFVGIGSGSLIKLYNEPKLYSIIGKDILLYIQPFIVQDSKIIIINGNIIPYLQKQDTIKISFKEYEAKFLIDIKNKGIGYSVGTKINVKNGISNFDISVGFGRHTVLDVVEVGDNGMIEKIEIIEPGKYILAPESIIETYSDKGNGFSADIKYAETSNRTLLERNVVDIYMHEGNSYLVLDYSLPPNIKNGKLSCDKNIILLSSNYVGDTASNIQYETFSNFTPNIKLPRMLKNSMSSEVVFNQVCLIIDEQIGLIKKHLGIK